MPTQTVNKSSLDNILQGILSLAHVEQNLWYSPKIYSDQRNVLESLLISALVRNYPENQTVIDQLSPFVEVQVIPITDGFIQLPPEYRNLLGSPMIFATPDSTKECNDQPILTLHSFKAGALSASCRMNPLVIVPQSEFADRTQSSYDMPSYKSPIGYYIDSKRIKVCPYNISRAAVMFVRKEKLVRYGYQMQPDDTYLYDEATTIETEFDSNAYSEIFNGMCALYSAYAKDQEMQNWTQILKERGIF